MFRNFENSVFVYGQKSALKKPSYGVVPVDQYDSQEFNLNDAGWVRNDISQLARAQSKAEFDMLLSRLVEIKNSGGLPDDMSVDDAINSIRPRWCQSPAELELFAEWTNSDIMSKLDEAYRKAVNTSADETSASSSESTD